MHEPTSVRPRLGGATVRVGHLKNCNGAEPPDVVSTEAGLIAQENQLLKESAEPPIPTEAGFIGRSHGNQLTDDTSAIRQLNLFSTYLDKWKGNPFITNGILEKNDFFEFLQATGFVSVNFV